MNIEKINKLRNLISEQKEELKKDTVKADFYSRIEELVIMADPVEMPVAEKIDMFRTAESERSAAMMCVYYDESRIDELSKQLAEAEQEEEENA